MAVRAARAEGPCPGGKDQDPRRPRRGSRTPGPQVSLMGGNEADLQAHDLAARMQGRQTARRASTSGNGV